MDGLERWRILRLHVEDQVPLAALARESGIGTRTLQRWHQLYKRDGLAGLDDAARTDKGGRRTDPATVAAIERLALTRPRPSIATLHRLTVEECLRDSRPVP
ncbi:TPA: helix-turn-helix domain-containing protein, partial [Enterococcus faecium]|nr:helix-turn-helix domain-containing protein [Enterococcus faecium]